MTIDPVAFDGAALAPATDTTARGQAPDFAAWLANQI